MFTSSGQIYLNGRVCQQPHSPRLAHIQVEGIRHDKPQHLAIQTLAASGVLSSRVELVYQGVTTPVSSEPSSEVGTDLSSILNSIHYKMGKKRMVCSLLILAIPYSLLYETDPVFCELSVV